MFKQHLEYLGYARNCANLKRNGLCLREHVVYTEAERQIKFYNVISILTYLDIKC